MLKHSRSRNANEPSASLQKCRRLGGIALKKAAALSIGLHLALAYAVLLLHRSQPNESRFVPHVTDEPSLTLGSHPPAPEKQTLTSAPVAAGPHNKPRESPVAPSAPPASSSRAEVTAVENPAATASYLEKVKDRIDSVLEYPLELRRRRISGKVGLRLIITSDGSLQSVDLEETSRNSELDRLALRAARKSAPFEAFGPGLSTLPRITLRLPVIFKLL